MDTALKRTFYDWILEIVILLILVWAFYPLFFYGSLGEDFRLPINYNAAGEPYKWGKRYYLWFMPLLSITCYIIFSLLERCYKKLTYPIKITEKNANLLYSLGIKLVRYIKLFIILFFAYINNASFKAALGKSSGVNSSIIVIGVIISLSILIFIHIKMVKLKDK